ncbi:MAG: hypothetical protein ACKO0W_06175 [Planctomycetota bacterium]
MIGTSNNPDAHHTRLECPRCGHALDPIVAAARAQGASGVVCGECGLATTVAAVEAAGEWPRWLVEAPGRGIGLPFRALRTIFACARSHRFWSAVPMERPLSVRGAIALAVALAALLHVAAFAKRALELPPAPTATERLEDLAWAAISPGSRFLGSQIAQVATAPEGNPRDTMRIVRRAFRHARDAWSLFGSDGSDARASDDGFKMAFPGRASGRTEPAPALRTLEPLSPAYWIGNPSTPPRELVSTPLLGGVYGTALAPLGPLSSFAREKLLLGYLLALAPVAALLLLPFSLRRAKVRARHVARAALYALVPGTLFAAVLFLALPSGSTRPVVLHPADAWTLATIALSAASLPWNHAFCARYLRLTHALGVAAAASLVGLLASLIAIEIFVAA